METQKYDRIKNTWHSDISLFNSAIDSCISECTELKY